MTQRIRGTIIKTPDASPGLLVADGQQKTFSLEGAWKSQVAPAVNMAVDIELDGAGFITSLTAVDQQQAAREKLGQIGGAAQEQGKVAVAIASQGVGALAARMGKATLVATVILWIAWFFMPVLTVQQLGESRAFTFWGFLALGLSNVLEVVLSSHGLLSIIGLAAIAAPFAAPFVRHPRAKFLYAMPLAYLILVAMAVLWDYNHAISEAQDTVNRIYPNGVPAGFMQRQLAVFEQSLSNSISISYGAFVIVLASLFLAMRVLKQPASENVPKPPTGLVDRFCMDCGKELIPGENLCAKCREQRRSAAGI